MFSIGVDVGVVKKNLFEVEMKNDAFEEVMKNAFEVMISNESLDVRHWFFLP